MELDLTEAVDAAAKAVYEAIVSGAAFPETYHSWDDLPDIHKHHYRYGVLTPVYAASEHLKGQILRELVAKIDLRADEYLYGAFDEIASGLYQASEIVGELLGEA